MTEYHFNADLAQTYGVDGAIFLHAMAFWVAKNQANGRHFHEGRTWTYNTLEALTKLFPFWSRRQIERITGKLREQGALLSGCFSEDKTDRTLWYALSDAVLETYGLLAPSISPNGEMDFTERGQPFHETVKCNKETVTDQLYNIPPKVPQTGDGTPKRGRRRDYKPQPDHKPERFARFWAYYPRGENKQAAIRAWDKLKPDDALIDTMARALERQKARPDWREGVGIPYASTWLNGRRWEDEERAPAAPAPAAPVPRTFHFETLEGEEVVVYDT